MKKIYLLLLFFLLSILTGLFFFGCESEASIKDGTVAPDFIFKDMKGKEAHLSSLKRKVVFLFFWKSTDSVCTDEMPLVQALHDKCKYSKFKILAINTSEDPSVIKDFMNSNKYTFSAVTGNGIDELYGTNNIGKNIILNEYGVIKHVSIGGTKSAEWEGIIKKLQAE